MLQQRYHRTLLLVSFEDNVLPPNCFWVLHYNAQRRQARPRAPVPDFISPEARPHIGRSPTPGGQPGKHRDETGTSDAPGYGCASANPRGVMSHLDLSISTSLFSSVWGALFSHHLPSLSTLYSLLNLKPCVYFQSDLCYTRMAGLTPHVASLPWQAAASHCISDLAPAAVGASRCLLSCTRLPGRPLHGARGIATSAALSRQTSRQASRLEPLRSVPSGGISALRIINQRLPALISRTYTTPAAGQTSEPIVNDIFEPVTGTWQYIIADPATNVAAIVDPVLDYDQATRTITTKTADKLLAFVKEKGYTISWILETHAHADHLTAASYLQNRLSQSQPGDKPPIGIGSRINKVQSLFGKRYDIPSSEYTDVAFDHFFSDDEVFSIGNLSATAIHLPGHTPDHMGYRVGSNVFCGDSIFIADIGTARCDFPGGSAAQLYNSAKKLLSMPDNVKIWTGHDYPPEGREATAYMTVGEHRKLNKHVRDEVGEQEFVKLRAERDSGLAAPRLLHQSLQTNIRGGRLPPKTEFGDRLMHLPVKVKAEEW